MIAETPTVSVVIPFRNRFDLVHEAVGSVIRQTMRSVEVVLVDDGSDEPFPIDRYTDSPIHIAYLRNEQNVGPAASRFVGLSKSRGEFVVFLDSDDLLADSYLEKQVTTMKRLGNAAFVYCFTKLFDGGGILSDRRVPQVETNRILPDMFLKGRIWCTSACLWNRAILARITPFDGYIWEDYRMDVSAALITNQVGCTPEYLCYYRVDSGEKLSVNLKRDYLKLLYSVVGILRTIVDSQARFPGYDCVMAKLANKYLTCLIKLNDNPAVQGYYDLICVKLLPWGLRYWLLAQKHFRGNSRLIGLRIAKRVVKRVEGRMCQNLM